MLQPLHEARARTVGAGEMGKRCEEKDWSATPLGPAQQWPAALRHAVQIVLAAGFPSLVLWGPQLVRIYNDPYRQLMGDKHPEAFGQPARETFPERSEETEPLYARVMQGETVVVPDALHSVARYGYMEDLHFAISMSPVRDDEGAVSGIFITLVETTEQVAARSIQVERERLLHAVEAERAKLVDLFRQAPAFLAVMRGPEHVLELANDAYLQLIGHRDVVGKPVTAGMPELTGQGFVRLLDHVFTTGKPFVGRELPINVARSPGAELEERFVDFVYQPLTEADGTRVGVVVHGSDVTEQVHARREVERLLHDSEEANLALDVARAEAEKASRAKADFLATMSHELRTPLNAIGGYADLLGSGVYGQVTPAQTQALSRIKTSQRHLLGLINSVLNYSRAENGQLTYVPEAVSIAEAVVMCADLMAPQLAERQLTFRVDRCDPSIAARADREKLQQILLNLVSNAIKFTPAEGVITAGCETRGDKVAIHLRDTGIGIPADRLESIFDPFVQVDSGFTRTQEGVGLGLAISRDLARGMGGDLGVQSSEGSGSTFTLTIPRA